MTAGPTRVGASGPALTRRSAVGALGAVLLGGCNADGVGGSATPPTPASATPSPGPAQPPRAAGFSTRRLLPYGTTYDIGGQRWTLERVAGPTLELRSSSVGFTDPGFLHDARPRPAARLAPRRLPCELGVLTTAEPPAFEGQRPRLGATVAFGAVRAVSRWLPAPAPDGGDYRFGVDAGMGCCYDVGALASLEGRTEPWEPLVDRVLSEIAVPLVVDGRTAAVVFDCGLGDGAYRVYAGHDRRGRTVAVMADLEIHHQGTAQA